MTRRIEPGDYTLLLHVGLVAVLLSVTEDDVPTENARTARDLVIRGTTTNGITRAEMSAEAFAMSSDEHGHRRVALRALASYLAVLEAAATDGGES